MIIIIIIIFSGILKYVLFFLFQYLSLSARLHFSNELLRNGWLDESAVVSDAELEAMYNDMLADVMEGSSPEFPPSWSDDEDTERTIPLVEEAAASGEEERWTQLAPVVIHDPPASPSTPPPSQPRRSAAVDIGELVSAATTAARATAWFAPEASEALAALAAAAARAIGGSTERARLPTPPAAAMDAATDTQHEPVPRTTGASTATSAAAGEDASQASGGATTSPRSSSVSGGNGQGSPPPYFGETPTCLICTDEMRTPGVINSCSHRDCCRRCLWHILRRGDGRCPLCRKAYQRVW